MTGRGRPGPGAAEERRPVRDVADAVLAAPARLGAVRLVAVDGPSGSGKSRLADALVRELATRGVVVGLVRTDFFATWDDPVDWWPRLVEGVLTPLGRGERGRYRRVVWRDGEPFPGPFVDVEVPDVLVVEGVSSARAEVAPLLSYSVWVEHPDPAARLERAVRRDGESSRPHLVAWQRFERGWFAADGAKHRADRQLVVTE
ncbi:AAA ATPase domain-containing protein [Streptoalloteichus tenebrarius]|uniref:AAA ATPase domain-containing protein n=1 Tax=Streptoalloteichus tenebrarius (strain ATCC 17920 / DSM 40477 / JCM 4838 / CBS 697.72 / NBRC 16177 / NCIMB 11028 / NRRL B-12390 / A12253. 1 / ISP 5477) TaxID=1933 RepID=A0ABT1HRI7_STRSD|nr:uridine kinase [Streptoalloteichus tenebrarius]MCP2258050.1 AAA ATPase domain-containing protein [Streptoalloteichus tenebrarius]BFF01721.1 4-amino-4-deoxychorismate synthase [Streptoalloteichus tenebrarius]